MTIEASKELKELEEKKEGTFFERWGLTKIPNKIYFYIFVSIFIILIIAQSGFTGMSQAFLLIVVILIYVFIMAAKKGEEQRRELLPIELGIMLQREINKRQRLGLFSRGKAIISDITKAELKNYELFALEFLVLLKKFDYDIEYTAYVRVRDGYVMSIRPKPYGWDAKGPMNTVTRILVLPEKEIYRLNLPTDKLA